jgi:Fe-S cluster assembly ATP-binding protein
MNKQILEIKELEASIENKGIIKKLNLEIKENEIHIIMGPNGSGKSTLSKILSGHPSYFIEKGQVTFLGKDLLGMSPEKRSQEGLFLAFQYPVEISGVTNYDFLRIAYNEKQKYLKKPELDPLQFMELIQKLLEKLKIKNEFLNRNLNEGFSGGEKKKNEILQMLLLQPKLVILDEIDSGLDIDAIKIICENISQNKAKNSSLLVITHYPKILQYLKPTYVHIMIDGKIIKTGNLEIVEYLEKEGYQNLA